MIETGALSSSETPGWLDRLFRGVVECTACLARRLMEVRRGDYAVLRRYGTVSSTCPQCGRWTPHRFVRLGS